MAFKMRSGKWDEIKSTGTAEQYRAWAVEELIPPTHQHVRTRTMIVGSYSYSMMQGSSPKLAKDGQKREGFLQHKNCS